MIAVVTGLPRSGSSMIMRMLMAGGFEVLQDNTREPDAHNPYGYFEYAPVLKLEQDNRWLLEVDDVAVKILTHLVKYMPCEREYWVIHITRDISEVVESQNKMARLESDEGVIDSTLRYREGLENWLNHQPNIRLLTVNYLDVIHKPQLIACMIAGFLGKSMNIDGMVGAVDPTLYRNRGKIN